MDVYNALAGRKGGRRKPPPSNQCSLTKWKQDYLTKHKQSLL